MVELLNTIFLLLFTGGLVAALYRIGRRILDYTQAGIRPPLLAIRDVGLLAGLAFPFVLILAARAMGLGPMVAGQLWWTIATGTPAVVGILQWVYFEYFVIEQSESRWYRKYMETAQQKEDRLAGDARRQEEENGRAKNG